VFEAEVNAEILSVIEQAKAEQLKKIKAREDGGKPKRASAVLDARGSPVQTSAGHPSGRGIVGVAPEIRSAPTTYRPLPRRPAPPAAPFAGGRGSCGRRSG
jgi:hypothetical protein